MKKNRFIYILIITVFVSSCKKQTTHYDIIVNRKSEAAYLNSINLSLEEVMETENFNTLISEEYDLLCYKYSIKEKDNYQITYRFDNKGCYEVGIDFSIQKISDANNVITGLKKYFDSNVNFKQPQIDNGLLRWQSNDDLIVAELDHKNATKGKVAFTLFAYE